jgi:hypothetical protein
VVIRWILLGAWVSAGVRACRGPDRREESLDRRQQRKQRDQELGWLGDHSSDSAGSVGFCGPSALSGFRQNRREFEQKAAMETKGIRNWVGWSDNSLDSGGSVSFRGPSALAAGTTEEERMF